MTALDSALAETHLDIIRQIADQPDPRTRLGLLRDLRDLQTDLDRSIRAALVSTILELRTDGASLADIGEVLSMSKQNVAKLLNRKDPTP